MILALSIIVFSIFFLIVLVTLPMFKSVGENLTVVEYDKKFRTLKLKYQNQDDIITVTGNSTVWHHLPSGRRCDTFMESQIVDAVVAYENLTLIL